MLRGTLNPACLLHGVRLFAPRASSALGVRSPDCEEKERLAASSYEGPSATTNADQERIVNEDLCNAVVDELERQLDLEQHALLDEDGEVRVAVLLRELHIEHPAELYQAVLRDILVEYDIDPGTLEVPTVGPFMRLGDYVRLLWTHLERLLEG